MSARSSNQLALVLLPAALVGCGAADDPAQDTAETATYDAALLAEYRAALPEEERVEAVVPGPEGSENALTELGDAELAWLAIQSAHGVNAPAKLIVRVLKAITKLPPTLYDSNKKEFIWGPWENDDGYGQVMAYIRQNGPEEDFKYGYALVRLVDSDAATAAPVVWGGATPAPDNDEDGVGVTLWDFEANLDFEKKHDPDFDSGDPHDEGRFAMLYGKGRGDNDDGDFAFNVAVFRDFVSKDAEEDEQPANLDYLFGHFDGDDGTTVDFLDWALTANFCGADPDTCFEMPEAGDAETLYLRSAFINRGIGRAEASVTGGDLNQNVSVVECWDDDIDRTYMSVSADDEMLAEVGACDDPFLPGLAELGIPTLADIDQEALAALDCAATNGLAACEAD